jgi:hypothetical protein
MSDYQTPGQALAGAITEADVHLSRPGPASMRLTGAEFGRRHSGDCRFYYVLTFGMTITSGPPDMHPDSTWKDQIMRAWECQYKVIPRPDTTA